MFPWIKERSSNVTRKKKKRYEHLIFPQLAKHIFKNPDKITSPPVPPDIGSLPSQ